MPEALTRDCSAVGNDRRDSNSVVCGVKHHLRSRHASVPLTILEWWVGWTSRFRGKRSPSPFRMTTSAFRSPWPAARMERKSRSSLFASHHLGTASL